MRFLILMEYSLVEHLLEVGEERVELLRGARHEITEPRYCFVLAGDLLHLNLALPHHSLKGHCVPVVYLT